jgi:hypothetical protein
VSHQPALASREIQLDHIEWLLTKAIIADHNNALALMNQVTFCYSIGRSRDALRQAELLARRYPEMIESKQLYRSIGRGYALIDERNEAVKYLVLHLVVFPSDSEALKSLAEASHEHAKKPSAPENSTNVRTR